MDDPKPTLSWRDVYDDRGQNLHVGQAAVAAAVRRYAYLYFDERIYRVAKDGTYTETELTEADVK
jgi:hypothetical protein